MESLQKQASSEMASSIGSLVHFCTDINVGISSEGGCLIKAIACSMQYIDRRALLAALFGEDAYVNWEAADAMHRRAQARKRGNAIGPAATWYHLLSFLRGSTQALQAQPGSARQPHRSFYLVHDAVRQGAMGDLSVSVRAFFAVMLMGIPPMSALQAILGGAGAKQHAQSVMIQISSEKFTPAQYLDTIVWLSSTGILETDTAALQREIAFHSRRTRASADAMRVYSMQAHRLGRPSLFQIASRHRGQHQQQHTGRNASAYDDYYTFQGFTHQLKFSSNMSTYVQQRAYWLACQQDFFPWRDYAHDFLPRELALGLLQYGSNTSPDPGVLVDVLAATVIVGPPFQALQAFRNSCLAGFPAIERVNLTMNDVFRLYVAAYQQRPVWKDVWKGIKPLLSTQIIKDVEGFVATHPMDCTSVVSIVLFGTSTPPEGARMGSSTLLVDTAILPSDSASVVGAPSRYRISRRRPPAPAAVALDLESTGWLQQAAECVVSRQEAVEAAAAETGTGC